MRTPLTRSSVCFDPSCLSRKGHLFDMSSICVTGTWIDPSLRKRTRDIRGEWRAAQRAGVFKFVHNDEEWQAERLALLVLNAYYPHDDCEKRQQIATFGAIGGMLTKQTFLHYMLDTANAASKVGAVVSVALAEGRFS